MDGAVSGGNYTIFNQSNASTFSDMAGNNWDVKVKKVLGGSAVSIIINAGRDGAAITAGLRICSLGSTYTGTKDVVIPLTSKLDDNPLSQAFAVLDHASGLLSIETIFPEGQSSQEYEGAVVYPID